MYGIDGALGVRHHAGARRRKEGLWAGERRQQCERRALGEVGEDLLVLGPDHLQQAAHPVDQAPSLETEPLPAADQIPEPGVRGTEERERHVEALGRQLGHRLGIFRVTLERLAVDHILEPPGVGRQDADDGTAVGVEKMREGKAVVASELDRNQDSAGGRAIRELLQGRERRLEPTARGRHHDRRDAGAIRALYHQSVPGFDEALAVAGYTGASPSETVGRGFEACACVAIKYSYDYFTA